MKFPWIAYWIAGYIGMLWISEHAPRSVTYSLLAILLIGALFNEQKANNPRPDNRGKAKQ